MGPNGFAGGKGVYAAIECVGAAMTRKVVNSVRQGGWTLIYGQFESNQMELDIMDLLVEQKKVCQGKNLQLKVILIGQALKRHCRFLLPKAPRYTWERIVDLVRAVSCRCMQTGPHKPFWC